MIEWIVRGLFIAQFILLGAWLFGWLTVHWAVVFIPLWVLIVVVGLSVGAVLILRDS